MPAHSAPRRHQRENLSSATINVAGEPIGDNADSAATAVDAGELSCFSFTPDEELGPFGWGLELE